MTRDAHHPVVTRTTRRVTTGCLLLLTLPAALLAYFWYSAWHSGQVNKKRERDAVAQVVQQAHDDADRTGKSLNGRHADETEAVDVIWQVTRAPVIQHGLSATQFTTYITRTTTYNELGVLPAGGPVEVSRCFALTYRHTPSGWTPEDRIVDKALCEPAKRIADAVSGIRISLEGAVGGGLTNQEMQRAFDSRVWHVRHDLRATHEDAGTTAITVNLTAEDTNSGRGTTQQCYRFDVPTPHDSTRPPEEHVTARPVPELQCAQAEPPRT
ncbi:hypothetical protein ABZ734_28065 [Streptomyces sp. NPDC006660]|uniref:hypothetical protein n=1 Tax=Streptomyces sp. NPDC006660 TaxID=3156901 RepID=UPI003408FF98